MSSCVYAMGKSTLSDQNPAARSSHPLLRSNLSHIFFTRELISVTIFLPFSVARDWRLNYCLIAGGGWLLFASVCISLHHLSYGAAFSLYSGVVAGKNIFTTTKFSLKIAEIFAVFLQNFAKFAKICRIFAKFRPNFGQIFSGFFPKCSIF